MQPVWPGGGGARSRLMLPQHKEQMMERGQERQLGLDCCADELCLYPKVNGEPLQGFRQDKDTVLFAL